MFNSQQLTPEEVEKIHQWVADGTDMSGLQAKLKNELGHSLTYMDTRFLALDLDLRFPEEEKEEPEAASTPEDDLPAPSQTTGSPLDPDSPAPTGQVQVTVDQLTRPGALVSGTVTFSDGERALWLIDEMGRPSIDPDTPGYQPTEADLMQFQNTLRAQLEAQDGGGY